MSEGSEGEGLVNEVLNDSLSGMAYLRNIPFMFQPLKTLSPLPLFLVSVLGIFRTHGTAS